MMQSNSGLTDKVLERILELSADAQIRRRQAVWDSSEFHQLSGAIAAYGKTLALFTALEAFEEFHAIISPHHASIAAVS
jgi:hypothetical protein